MLIICSRGISHTHIHTHTHTHTHIHTHTHTHAHIYIWDWWLMSSNLYLYRIKKKHRLKFNYCFLLGSFSVTIIKWCLHVDASMMTRVESMMLLYGYSCPHLVKSKMKHPSDTGFRRQSLSKVDPFSSCTT